MFHRGATVVAVTILLLMPGAAAFMDDDQAQACMNAPSCVTPEYVRVFEMYGADPVMICPALREVVACFTSQMQQCLQVRVIVATS